MLKVNGKLEGRVIQENEGDYATIEIDLPPMRLCATPMYQFEHGNSPLDGTDMELLDVVRVNRILPNQTKTVRFYGFQYFRTVQFWLRIHCSTQELDAYDRYTGSFEILGGRKQFG